MSVLAYENLPVRDEIELFVDINTKQVKVSRNLVNEIVSSLNVEDPDPESAWMHCARVALGWTPPSVADQRTAYLTVAQEKTHTGVSRSLRSPMVLRKTALSALCTEIGKNGETMIPGPLGEPSVDSKLTMDKAAEALSRYYAPFCTIVSRAIGTSETTKADISAPI